MRRRASQDSVGIQFATDDSDGILPAASCELIAIRCLRSNHFQPDLVLGQQLLQRRHRRLVGDQAIDQGDRPESDHGVTPELAGVRRQQHFARIGDDRLGDPHFLIIEVQQTAVFVDTADADQLQSPL